jgi:hypothetical protein
VIELGNEIRWVDEEGVKARLEAESVLRSRIDALAARLEALEDGMQRPTGAAKPKTPTAEGALSKRFAAGTSATGGTVFTQQTENPGIPRDVLVKHVRVRRLGCVKFFCTCQRL